MYREQRERRHEQGRRRRIHEGESGRQRLPRNRWKRRLAMEHMAAGRPEIVLEVNGEVVASGCERQIQPGQEKRGSRHHESPPPDEERVEL